MFAFRIALSLSYLVLRRSLRRSRPAIPISLALLTLGLMKLTQLSHSVKEEDYTVQTKTCRTLHVFNRVLHVFPQNVQSSARLERKRAELCTFLVCTMRHHVELHLCHRHCCPTLHRQEVPWSALRAHLKTICIPTAVERLTF